MKKHIKRFSAFFLVFILIINLAVPARASKADEVVAILYPNRPVVSKGYPAQFILSMPGGYFTVDGTCSVFARIYTEEMFDILVKAVPDSGYQNIDRVIDDKLLVRELAEKFEYDKNDYDRVKENLLKLLGFGSRKDIALFFSPVTVITGYENPIKMGYDLFSFWESGSDAVEFFTDLTAAGWSLKQLETWKNIGNWIKSAKTPVGWARDVAFNGVQVTWEEFQKMKQWADDMDAYYKANNRLRVYYDVVDYMVDNLMSEKGVWTIDIFGKDTQPYKLFTTYPFVDEMTVDVDISLKKTDGSPGNTNGVYTGSINVKTDGDYTYFDWGMTDYLLNLMNRNFYAMAQEWRRFGQEPPKFLSMGPSIGSDSAWVMNSAKSTDRPTVYKTELKRDEYDLTLSLPRATNRAFLEIPLDMSKIDIPVYELDIAKSVYAEIEDFTVSGYWELGDIYTETENESINYFYVKSIAGQVLQANSNEWNPAPDKEQVKNYMKMTITVDMLSDEYLED